MDPGSCVLKSIRIGMEGNDMEGEEERSKAGKVWAKKSPGLLQGSINMAATYSPAFLCSTMGHEGLNFSVRYGKR
jgi:hypothetical protein